MLNVMNFWNLMVRKDDWICTSVNFLSSLFYKLRLKEQKLLYASRSQTPKGIERDIFIILNGPSLKEQDLSILKDKSLLFVNRGFNHTLYKDLKPEFHAFIDPKMITGEWPVTWIDDILLMVPDITFLMPVSWAFNDKLAPYIKKGLSVYWLEPDGKCTCLGVSGSCFNFAISQKYKNIYFTGFDANGIAFELTKSSSHFYGVNSENLKKTSKDYVIDLFMHSRHLHDLNRFAERCRKKKISIINLTEGGLLDMFPRKHISEIV